MERVVKLALEVPSKLRAVEVTGVDLKNISVHGSAGILQVDQNLDGGALCFACRKGQEWMVVETEMVEDFSEI